MPRRGSRSLSDRIEALRTTERALVEEVERLRRDERYVTLKVRQARDQVRYYEGLLALLRRDWGDSGRLNDLVRRLG